MDLRICVPCHFGLESSLAFEVRKIGGCDIVSTDGKVSFSGDENTLAKANLWISGRLTYGSGKDRKISVRTS